MGAPRDESEAAYFTLLRAREEAAALARYREFLDVERLRLTTFLEATSELQAPLDPRLRRPLTHTDRQLAEVVRARLGVVDDERARLDDRCAAAEAFIAECEGEVARLRVG